MRLSLLPPNLLDLAMVRAYSASPSLRQGAVAVKYASRSHGMKRPVAVYPGSLAKFRPAQPEYRELEKGTEPASAVANLQEPKEKLSERVKALEEVAAVEKAALEEFTYSEQELLALYADLLTVPPEYEHGIEESDMAPIQKPDDKLVIASVEQRLFAESALQGDELSRVLSAGSRFNRESTSAHRRILAHVHEFVQRIEGTRSQASAELNAVRSGTQSLDKQMVPISILTLAEHEALIRTAAYEHDHEAVDFALDLLRRTGLGVMEEAVNTVLEIYAAEGNPTAFEHILGTYLTGSPTDAQRHLHVKSHIKAAPANAIPNSALSLLHSYEEQSLPAPMKTYTSVISTLFKTRKSVARAQAWDLFSHMRYVAHPNPDAFLYVLMIRACAYPISASLSSEPERALDLWTEMTVDHRIPPTSQAYNAVILACARSGSEVYINEAFRLAKQMLDSHRDAYGRSAFKPTRSTFLALLEGAKRIGDLARARYILAQMVTEQSQRPDILADECVNEQVMVHVFQTYSAYEPPFKRSQTLFVNQTQQSQPQPTEIEPQRQDGSAEASAKQQIPEYDTSIIQQASLFTHIPPQTQTEVIAEVKILFDSILQDNGIAAGQAVPAEEIFPTSSAKFRHVTITSRLINAYLSIYFRHSSLEASRELFWLLYDKCNVVRSPRCYVNALEACSTAKPGYDRTVAVQFADELWKQWMVIEETWNDTHPGRLDTRLVERAHVAMIRLLALTDNVDRALQHVRMFEKRYPPSDVRKAGAKPAFRSTRTSLTGLRPLVRVTTDANVPDDSVPPLLMFQDLELLHHRLVARGAAAEISYIKYLCKSYEWALRIRRDETMKARPEKTESSVALTFLRTSRPT